MEGIIREPTIDEKKDFQDIGTKRRTVEESFTVVLKKHETEATKKGVPFATQVAKIEWDDHYQEQAKLSMRRHGFVNPEDIKPIEMDWAKYSDLKNFELIDEGERVDDYLTKVNPGLTVRIKWKKYRYIGFSYTYRIMESGPDAINRAIKFRKDLETGKK